MFKLWIDDRRPAPEGWRWAKSVHEAKLNFIQLGGCNGKPGIISLDHDAGAYQYMGGDYIKFLEWLELKRHEENWNINITFHIHSQNPVGVQNMRVIIQHNNWKEM